MRQHEDNCTFNTGVADEDAHEDADDNADEGMDEGADKLVRSLVSDEGAEEGEGMCVCMHTPMGVRGPRGIAKR